MNPARRNLWAPAALAVAAVTWVFVVPQLWVFLATAGFILAIATLGLTVVGWVREVSLAQAALVGSAVYISGYAMRGDGWDWPYLAGALVGIVAAAGLAALVALPTARLSGIYIMVLTLGLQITIERTIFASSKLNGGNTGFHVTRPEFLGVNLEGDRAFYFFCLAVLVVVMAFLALLRSGRHGRALVLVGTDRQAAAAIGVSPWRYKVLAFVIAGALAGVAGALSTPLYRSPPTFFQYISFQSLFYLAIPVVAGFESLVAVVLVAGAFTMIPHAIESFHISTFVLGGIGLILGTSVGPRGLGGVVLDVVRSRRRAGSPSPAGVFDAERATVRSPSGEVDLRPLPVMPKPVLAGVGAANGNAANGNAA
ncbi:MAG TPA: branched-chain amino acid ABC transporter permease, partial [Acidimicrobiia bacterium]|nr:branched-chain amino acid ABC transporter permease [Acidimicrobiia bacterium]